MKTLADLRADFESRSNRSLSMPVAGAIVWTVIGLIGLYLPFRTAVLVLAFGTGAIFPLAMLIARVRREELLSRTNPLARLMGACVFMVNLLWGVHIPLLLHAPQFVPLSLGIGLGLHWVVYSWIVGHPIGYVHAAVRTAGLVLVWFAFPAHLIPACAFAVVAAYCLSIAVMACRHLPDHPLARIRVQSPRAA